MPWPVLLLCRELDLGGSERQMTETAKSLDRSRFEPHVGAFRPQGIRADELRALGIPVVHFPVYSFQSPATIRQAFRLASYIRRHNIRLVHAWDYPLNLFAVPVARAFTSAVALKSQRSHRSLMPPFFRKMERASDRIPHAIIVNCEFVREHLERDEGVPAERIRIARNGIDLDRFHPRPGPRRPELEGSSLVIVTVCALRPEKGLSTLIQAVARIRSTHPCVKLAVVGSGPELNALQALARSLGVAESCLFVRGTHEVPEWLRSSDIFVLPSRTEALSNALMEAMACGCAVIASDVGGNPELVKPGENGLLFEPGDVDELTNAIRQLIDHPDHRRRLADAAVETIRQRFSTAVAANRMGEIYADLIQAQGQR